MRLLLPLAVCALGWSSIAHAQHPGSFQPLGCAPLPSMATAVYLNTVVVNGTVGIPSGATLADIQVTTQNVNYRDDGTAPTATTGITIFAGPSFLPYSAALNAMQLIQVAGTATGFVCFYRG